MSEHDDFLSDPEATPDPRIQRLEELLSVYQRDPPELPELPELRVPALRRPRVAVAVAASLLLVVGALALRLLPRGDESPRIARELPGGTRHEVGPAHPNLPPLPSPGAGSDALFDPPLASEPNDCTAPGDEGAFLALAPAGEPRPCAGLPEAECEGRPDCRVVRGERFRPRDEGWCRDGQDQAVGCVETPEACTYDGAASVGTGDSKEYWELDGCLPGWVPCDLPEGTITACTSAD
jgi:hypothetical protein